MNRIAICLLALAASLTNASAQGTKDKHAQMTFLDSKLFDGQLAKELQGDSDVVEIKIAGKMSLNNIPTRVDKWITVVGENGELAVKAADPALEPKFFAALIPVVYSFLKQNNEERSLDVAKKYNATILYRIDASGDSQIDRIVFTRKK